MKKTWMLVVVVLVIVILASAGAADSIPRKDQCKDGGWEVLYGVAMDGTLLAFKNQGQCIKYVNHGGEFAVVAVDDEVITSVDIPVTIDVLANDSYDDLVVASLQVGPSSGVVGPWVGGTITYYPDLGFFGTESFIYKICGASPPCDTATVTITVGP